MNKKLIGLYQLITGVFGVILVIYTYLLSSQKAVMSSQSVVLQIVLGVLFYGLLAWSGYALLNNLRNAKRYSMMLQALQIPLIAGANFIYKISASAFFAVGIRNGKLDFMYSLQPIDFVVSGNPSSERLVMVYLIPIIILYGLSRIKN